MQYAYTYLSVILVSLLADQPEKAMIAYERAHAWRELFGLALKQGILESELVDMAERVSGMSKLITRC